MKYKITALLFILTVAVSSIGMFTSTQKASAAAPFDGSRVIDDFVFNNYNSMTAAQVDAFLNTFSSSCISTNNGFSAPDPTGYSPSGGYTYGGNVSAGTVITHAAQAYQINPQVLLTTIQKEQSLVSGGSGCSTLRYTGAAGYGCPDGGTDYSYSGVNLYTIHGVTTTSVSGTCVNSSSKAGFSQQVIHAAWLLKFGEERSEGNVSWAIITGSWNNSDDPQSCYSGPMTQGTWQICPKGQSIYYDGYQTIDGTATYMTNGATASLYYYTPHFSGNQSFFNTFTNYFGLPYANDTDSAHPNGALISESGHIYLLVNGQRDYISNSDVFNSYHYAWSQVEAATSGDVALPEGPDIASLAPGTLFTAPGQPVYAMEYDTDGTLKKEHVSLQSFNSLGYSWNDVMQISANEVPAATISDTLYSNTHPSGTFVTFPNNPSVYMVSKGTLEYVSAIAFSSYGYSWSSIKAGTSADSALTSGTALGIRQGTMVLANGNIYDIDYSTSTPATAMKRPIGPWQCYANQMHYTSDDWLVYDTSVLPTTTGSNITC